MGMIETVKTKQNWMPRVAALAAALALSAPSALAQLAQNSAAPVDITADELETLSSQCQAIYRGGAEALQDTVRLRADVLKIMFKPGAGRAKANSGSANCGAELDRMEATGGVFYVTPQRRVRGDQAVYEKSTDTITISGDVIAIEGKDVVRGGKMVIKVSTGDGQMQGGSKSTRVRTVIYPKKDPQPAAAPAPKS